MIAFLRLTTGQSHTIFLTLPACAESQRTGQPARRFKDFQYTYDDSLQSYKGVMVDQYLELLLYHLLVLDGEGAKEDVVRDLLLGSAMRDEKLWKYSKSKEVFEQIFKKQ